MKNELKGTTGAAQGKPQASQVKSAMSFSMDGVYLGLKPSFKFDEKTQEWIEQPLTLKASFFGQFVTLPQNGKFFFMDIVPQRIRLRN